jgi:beta-barrel assembly-enhancing protease
MLPLLILTLANATEYKCLASNSVLFSEPVSNSSPLHTFPQQWCNVRTGLETDGFTRIESLKGSGWTYSSDIVTAPTIDSGLPATLKNSKDSEKISGNRYYKRRADCSEFAHLHDIIKDIGKETDRILRDGISMKIEDEQELGKKIIPEIEKSMNGRLVTSGERYEYMQSLLKKIIPKTTRKGMTYTLFVVEESDVENAFATPGGYLYITDKLIDTWVHNEAQLIAVLGHEVAHVDLHHTTALAEYYLLLEQQGNNLALDIAHTVISRPYSSLQEGEADIASLQWLIQMGYSPFTVADMWEKMEPDQIPTASSDSEDLLDVALDIGFSITESVLEGGLSFIETHPPPQKRACEIRQVAYDILRRSDVQSKQRLYIGSGNYQYKRPFPATVY